MMKFHFSNFRFKTSGLKSRKTETQNSQAPESKSLKSKSCSSRSCLQAEKSGFTMVELTLTMAFVGVLMITIAIITTNIVTIYQKGLTLKAVNSVGRGLIDEFTSGINVAPSVDTTSLCNSLVNVRDYPEAFNNCQKDHAFKYIYQSNVNQTTGEQLSGVFCTGRYSYIWNTFYGEEYGQKLKLVYNDLGGNRQVLENFRLARFEDRNYRACSSVTSADYRSQLTPTSEINIQTLAGSTSSNPLKIYTPEPTQGMLEEFDLDLTLYELTIFPVSQDSVTLRTYMSGTFILATLRGDVDIMRSGDYCNVNPANGEGAGSIDNLGSEFNYCAINKFNFAARTAGV